MARNNPFDILALDFGLRKNKRDSRRTFTITQKKEILYQQNNKCAICHRKLDPRAIEFDHGKPWADGGRTITQMDRHYV